MEVDMPQPKIDDELEDLPVGKSFTQDEVNRFVQERLERYKRKMEAHYAEQTTQLEQLAEEAKALHEVKDKYDASIKERLTEQRKGLPASVVALLDKLSPEEQEGWLKANGEALMSKPQPGMPEPPSPKSGTPPSVEQERAQICARIGSL